MKKISDKYTNATFDNIKNIDDNKKKIQELNEQLVIHEKKKVLYDNRLESLEQQLKLNFFSNI